MKVAVLPFIAAEGTPPEYGRQFSAFAAEQLRIHANADVSSLSMMAQIPSPQGPPRAAFINPSFETMPYDQLKGLIDQWKVDKVQSGFLKQDGDTFHIDVRFHGPASEEAISQESFDFNKKGLFDALHKLVKLLADQAEVGLPELLAGEKMEFGTENPDAFLALLEGYDALNYINQASGLVAPDYNPQIPIDSLLKAIDDDPDFEGPYHVLVQLCRACAQFRLGTFESAESALVKLTDKYPAEFPAYFALGEIHQSIRSLNKASEYYDKAVQLQPEDAALHARLGIVQMQLGMPVNAERNFKRAFDLEGPDKPSADLLATVLGQTNRGHEVPLLYKGMIDADPQNASAHARYAMALVQTGSVEQGERAFESALDSLEDNLYVKRAYAPYLAQKGESDRAMDFYEDVLDATPNDVAVLAEYAQTLENAGREFEAPAVLKRILANNPEPNLRANVMARLIELEQPKRAENVGAAQKKLAEGDFAGAARDLKPMRNWLGDYWKLWAMLASAHNHLQEWPEAEEAAKRCLSIFPGCEPAFIELANATSGSGRLDEAYEMLKGAVASNPASVQLAITFALAAKRAGHLEESRDVARQLREALGSNSEVEPVLVELES